MQKFFFAILTAILALTILYLPACASQKFNTRNRLIYYSWQFANEVLHSPEDVRQIKAILDINMTDSAVYHSLRMFGREMFERGEQAKAFEYFKHTLDILEENTKMTKDELRYKSSCYLMLGAATDEVGMQQLSIEFYLKGLKISEELGDYAETGRFFNNIGVCHFRTQDLDEAEQYFRKALDVNTKHKNNLEMSINYSNLSEIFGMRNELDSSVEYALKAIQCLDEKKHPYDYYMTQSTIGWIYAKKNEFHMARTWLENAYNHQKTNDYKNSLFYTCLAMMELADKTSDNPNFVKYSKEAEQIAREIGNFMLLNEYYKSAGNVYRSRGQSDKAYELAEKYIAVQDSAYRAENKSRMEQALNIYNLEKKTKAYESSISNWNPVVILAICGSIALVLLGLLFWVITMSRRAEKARRDKQKTDEVLAALRELHLQEEIKRNEEASRQIHDNQRSLAAVTLEKIKINQTIDEVLTESRQILLSISARDKENRERLKSIIGKLSSIDNEVNWDEFQMYFAKVHPDFYRLLDQSHPELTPKDRRLCALVSLGLSSKEIAALTFREVRSVETSRNRLRKKLDIASEVNLEDYLLHLTLNLS